MSADELRQAASEIRDDYTAEACMLPTPDPFMYAVAALLEFAAPFGNQPQPYSPTVEHAHRIARAYLGSDA